MVETKEKNYNFIDNIRGISMMAIVMEHCSLFWGLQYEKTSDKIIQSIGLGILKPGTIIFFILAGFLIGNKFNTYSTLEYLKRRTQNTIKPWLFWIGILLFLDFTQGFIRYIKGKNLNFFETPLLSFLQHFEHIVFYTSFWFILNFLICILILLLCRKYIYSVKLGIGLFLMSVFYAVNLYFNWILTAHTTALFGFVFYLWLGVQLNKYHKQFHKWVYQTKTYVFIALFLSLLVFSIYEGMYLMSIGSKDPFNTLKFSNIIFSLVTFCLLYKHSNIRFIEKIRPRATTFGIYLIHQIIIIHALPVVFRVLHLNIPNLSSVQLLMLQMFRFIVTYTLSYFIVFFIWKKGAKIKWIIGQ